MSWKAKIIDAKDINISRHSSVTVKPYVAYHLFWFLLFFSLFSGSLICILIHFFYDAINIPIEMPHWFTDFYKGLKSDTAFYLSAWLAFFFMLFVLMARSMLKKALNPNCWLIKADSVGVHLRFRSFLNQGRYKGGTDPVLFIPTPDINSVQEVRYTRVTKRGNESRHQYCKAVEFNADNIDADLIQKTLNNEKNKKSRSGLTWRDFPVRLLNDDTLRVEFGGMHPSPKKFILKVKRWYPTKVMKRLENEIGEDVLLERLRKKK